jgi:Glycosyl hydrolases family 28
MSPGHAPGFFMFNFNDIHDMKCLTPKYVMLLVVSALVVTVVSAQTSSRNVLDYGAKPVSGFLNTAFIQKAIDEASTAGGGRVVVPRGIFITGSIELKSGVNLYLEEGAVIEGSTFRKDYEAVKKPALIISINQNNISITGKGLIDGKGRELMKDIFKRLEAGTLEDSQWKIKRPREGARTNLIYFEDCSNVAIKGVSFKDATSWVTHYERCRNVTIDSIKLESMAYWNNDGIDIVDCRNVRITNSNINAADDAICLKSARVTDYCDSIYISDCTLRSSASAFRIGTGSIGGFRNITVRNIKVYDTYRSAIALEAVDGGFLENIEVDNVVATNTGNAVFIKLGHRNNDGRYSVVRNISIRNMKVEVPATKPDAGYEMEGPLLKYPPWAKPGNNLVSVTPWNDSYKDPTAIRYLHNVFPSSVSGLPGHPVENIRLENIEISYAGGADRSINYFPVDSFQLITEAEKMYPEFAMFGEVPVWGFYARHVTGLNLSNIRLVNKKQDYRSAMLLNDVKTATLNKIKLEGATAEPVLLLHDVKPLEMRKINIPGKLQHKIRNNNK